MLKAKSMKPKSTGSKRTALAASSRGANGRSAAIRRGPRRAYPFFAICIEQGEYEPLLHVGKAYRVIRPEPNDPAYLWRVIDEEGEDYLYPAEWFVPVQLPPKAKRALVAARGE